MDLYELKQKIDEAQQGQADAAKAVVVELDKLDIPHNRWGSEEFLLREANKKKEFLQIYASTSSIDLNVFWWVGCREANCDERDCDGEHRKFRKATADEVIFVLDNYLREKLRGIQTETNRLRKISSSIAEISSTPKGIRGVGNFGEAC